MASDSPFDAVRRFYQEGGFVDAPAPKQPSDRLKRLEALYGSQHFADGGRVMLRWMKNLLGHGTANEQKAVRTVSDYMATKGHEANVSGESLGEVLPMATLGFSHATKLPDGYGDLMRRAGDTPTFQAHAHPSMDALPSEGDWRVWGNAGSWDGKYPDAIRDPNFSRADSWISIPSHGPNANTLIPALERSDSVDKDADLLKEILRLQRAGNDRSPLGVTRLFEFGDDFAKANNIPIGNSDDAAKLFSSFHHAAVANGIANKVPILIDPAGRASPHTGFSVGEVWPELFKYFDRKGYNPFTPNGFSDGGSVEGFSEGGKFAPMIQALKQSLARSVRTPDNTYRTDEAIDKIHNLWGLDQARRLEEAADRGVDLSHYQPRALERATDPEAGHLFSTIHPSQFQDFAARIPDEFMERVDYPLAERSGGNRTLEQILQEYSDIAKKPGYVGWSHVPELHIGVSTMRKSLGNNHFVPPFHPEVKQHNGRHRNMALDMFAPLDIAPDSNRSLVTLIPYGRLAKPDPDDITKYGVPDVDNAQERLRKYLADHDNRVIPEPEGLQNSLHSRYLSEATLPQLETPFRDGGEVPGYAGGGAQIMRKGFAKALEPILEYLGGLKRNPIQYHPEQTRQFSPHYSTAYQHDPNDSWKTAMDKGRFPYQPDIHPDRMTAAMTAYTSSDYHDFNAALRGFAENKNKDFSQTSSFPYGHEWWRTGRRDNTGIDQREQRVAGQASDLAKYLQDMEYELPFDAFRGSRTRVVPDLLSDADPAQVHGRGFGSFTFRPEAGLEWGASTPGTGHSGAGNVVKVPSTLRIPQGTKVRGANVMPYSEMHNEFEVLLAPFQGFDVTDVNLLHSPKGRSSYYPADLNRLLLDIEPSNSYNPYSPQIYRDGGEVPGYADGGKLGKLIQYMRGISQPIRAHHGSPHDFDKFDSSMIGKGEGNQTFGHGLYFAENPAVAEYYAEVLGRGKGPRGLGNLYDVNIHEDPARFLSLDKPFNLQGETGERGYEALRKFSPAVNNFPDNYLNKTPNDFPHFAEPYFAQEAATNGLPGFRYLDAHSRAVGQGTHNYVTFPGMDDLIEITRKYADGGNVEELSGGGKFDALRSYLEAIHDVIKKPITVGVGTNVVPKVVKDGRFKSQFETGTSNGSYEPDYRAKFERDAFGLPLDLPVEKRPIYGHVADRDTLDTARHYGDWGAVLDPKVNERSTFYLGDSLGSLDPYGPYPFKPPSKDERTKEMLKSFAYDRFDGRGDRAVFTPRNLKGLLDSATLPGRYLEAQVHDGLPWSDVRALIGKREMGHPDDARETLQKMADQAQRPVFGPVSPYDSYERSIMKKQNPTGNYTLRWMRADPGYETHKVQEVPVSALSEFGYEDGGDVRPLMTGYDGQFYNDGGAVDHTIEALNRLRGMKQ